MEDSQDYNPTPKKAWDGGQIYLHRRHPKFKKTYFAHSMRRMGVHYRYYKNVSITGVPVAFVWDSELKLFDVVARIRTQMSPERYHIYERNWK